VATMPPSSARCTFYTADETGLGLTQGVETWLTAQERPTPHGHLAASGHRGIVYHVGALAEASHRHPEWPADVHDWLQARSGMPTALIVVWE